MAGRDKQVSLNPNTWGNLCGGGRWLQKSSGPRFLFGEESRAKCCHKINSGQIARRVEEREVDFRELPIAKEGYGLASIPCNLPTCDLPDVTQTERRTEQLLAEATHHINENGKTVFFLVI